MIGKRIKRYELQEELGRGGMAVVYLALDTALDRQVAIKVLHPHLASRPESAQRFVREARAVAKLQHRNILEIYDFAAEDTDETKYLVTEYIDGANLREFVEFQGIDFPEVAMAVTANLCLALEHAHEVGIIHRDIKPENIMIRADGRVKVMDFGIAYILDADRMTASGSLLGSPAHMPPEIIDGRKSDVRGDIFSLGTVLYFLAAGQLPFSGNTPTQVLRNIIESRFSEPTMINPQIGRGLNQIIKRCLEHDPEDRFPTMRALREALEAELQPLGFEDPVELAESYLSDPRGKSSELRPQILDRLVDRAREKFAEKKIACVSDLLNRALAIEPRHEAAHALLKRVHGRMRRRVIAGIVAACLVLFGLSYFLMNAAQAPEPAPDPEAEAPAPTPSPSAALLAHQQGQRAAVLFQAQRHEAIQAEANRASSALSPAKRIGALASDGATAGATGVLPGAYLPTRLAHATVHISDAVPRKTTEPPPKKTREGEVEDPEGSTDTSPELTQPEPEEVRTAEVRIGPVFPKSGASLMDEEGKTHRFDEGFLNLALPEGTHRFKVKVKDRKPTTFVVKVLPKDLDKNLNRLPNLEWVPGTLKLQYDESKFTAAIVWRPNQKLEVIWANSSREKIYGFSPLGGALKGTVFFIPPNTEIDPLDLGKGKLSKYAEKSRPFTIKPNTEETIIF